jgi:TetR/AcrR family transcriptional regulator, cholesterol catabolism regulator
VSVHEEETDVAQLGRRERKKLDVQRRIRRAAAELIRLKGYEATTVEEIAERADVAKGTFFNHFPRKDSLLEALAEELLEEVASDLGPAEGWTGPVREQVRRLFLRLAEMEARDPELSKVMIIENMRNFWLRPEPDPVHLEFRRMIETVLDRATERGEIHRDVDTAVGARLLEAVYVTTVVEWLKVRGTEAALREELLAKFDIVFRGMGCADGSERRVSR